METVWVRIKENGLKGLLNRCDYDPAKHTLIEEEEAAGRAAAAAASVVEEPPAVEPSTAEQAPPDETSEPSTDAPKAAKKGRK